MRTPFTNSSDSNITASEQNPGTLNMKDRRTCEALRKLVEIEIGILPWYGHVSKIWKLGEKCMEIRIYGRRLVGSPIKNLRKCGS